jgi:hypothetical protein
MLRSLTLAACLGAVCSFSLAIYPAQAGGRGYPYGDTYPGYAQPRYLYGPEYTYDRGNCCRGLFGCCDRGYYAPAGQYVLVAPPPPPVIQNITNYNVIYVVPDKCAPEPLYDIDGQTIWSVRAGCPQTR